MKFGGLLKKYPFNLRIFLVKIRYKKNIPNIPNYI